MSARIWILCTVVLGLGLIGVRAQSPDARGAAPAEPRGVPVSQNLLPHFEQADGRTILYVDGHPFAVLAVEIPWWHLVHGRYAETLGAYDYLYPAARQVGLNALKVPIKWAMVEPRPGEYDFSYVDHVKQMAERHRLKLVLNWFGHYASGDGNMYLNLAGDVFAPMDIIADAATYPRAVDADGVAHHNAASYNSEALVEREISAFRAFMEHIERVDANTRTIVMIQVENEISVFGSDRRNPKLWRDHSPASNRLFAEKGFTDDLEYSAWNLSENWIRPLTDAGAEVYPLPFFLNFVGGRIADSIVGGAPGEDVETYLENCPNISFIGVNAYYCAEWRPDASCARPSRGAVDELREPLARYRVGRNLPALTETNSGDSPVAPRVAFIAVGEFGAPIVAPWALTTSYPEKYSPYVLPDGTLANGAFALRDAYTSLSKALPQVAYYAGTEKLKVFLSRLPGQQFAESTNVNGLAVSVTGSDNGQAIVIHPSPRDVLIVGYRVNVSFTDPVFEWPAIKNLQVEKIAWSGDRWIRDGEPSYWVNQSSRSVDIELGSPQAIHVRW